MHFTKEWSLKGYLTVADPEIWGGGCGRKTPLPLTSIFLQLSYNPGNLTSAGNSMWGQDRLRANRQEVGKCSTRGGSRGT